MMEWKEMQSGLGWSKYTSGVFTIEPEDLDTNSWELWLGKEFVKAGTLSECKDHAQTLAQ